MVDVVISDHACIKYYKKQKLHKLNNDLTLSNLRSLVTYLNQTMKKTQKYT